MGENGNNSNEEIIMNEHKINPALKKSVIQIISDELNCLRAIATGISREAYGTKSNEYSNMRKGRNIQEVEAKKLADLIGIDYNTKIEYEHIKAIEDLTGYQITIISGDYFNKVVYPKIEKGNSYIPPVNDDLCIYLWKRKKQYDLIATNRIAGFFAKDYFCHKCKKTYKKKDTHKCDYKCNMCCKNNCDVLSIHKSHLTYKLKCEDCNRFFPTKNCFLNHKIENDEGVSMCSKIWKCHKCKKVMIRETFPIETHLCGDYLCSNCNCVVHKDHKCYMFPARIKAHSEKYIFFDFEADISDINHKVMYAISMYFDDETPITHTTIEEWCNWAFDKKHKGYTFIAHNGRGYDYKFVIKWLYDNTDYKPNPIFAGAKIMYLSVPELKIRFIDSLSFVTRALADFPKIFGEKELKKGYFPHWFNKAENWNYEGMMPPLEEFHPDEMPEHKRGELIEWYDKLVAENYVWNQQKEMREYCISDVNILRRCCIKFRKLYIEIAEIDPFQYLTIASVCMAIFKYFYIDETYPKMLKMFDSLWEGKTIQRIQKEGNLEIYNQSKKMLDDGIYKNIFNQKKIACFTAEEVEFMRKSFFGGRTNATKLIYNFKEGEEGKYIDFTSLYPATQYYDVYPQGHPIKILEDEITEEHYEKLRNGEYFGFVECVLQPPNDLYHPVLPEKGEKLVFDLHLKEGVWATPEINKAIEMGYVLQHIETIWHFEETTTDLFKKYVRKFLKIKQEASGWPMWVEKPEGKEWEYPPHLKEKAKDMSLDELKELYIMDYFENQGIMLEEEKINKNSGLREIAKLCLNSLWGKFGQRTNLSKTEVVTTKEEYFKVVSNPEYTNIDFIEIGEIPYQKIQLRYDIKEEFLPPDFNTNIAIASFTTASARMRLYGTLEYFNERVLYFDTDSVIVKYNPNDPKCNTMLPLGDYLGDLTDELDGKKMAGTFASGGPKNYTYEVQYSKGDNQIVEYKTKVKGFGLNYRVSQKINHHTITEMIKDNLEYELDNKSGEWSKINVSYNMIKRTTDQQLQNWVMNKDYGLVYTKRHILPIDELGNYDTLPFGHKDIIKYL